jgi:NDP-sugar pyrophosphorylase family protein
LNYIPLNQRLDLPDLVLKLLKEGQKVNVFNFDGYWLDIGRPDDYERAIEEFAKHRPEFIKE